MSTDGSDGKVLTNLHNVDTCKLQCSQVGNREKDRQRDRDRQTDRYTSEAERHTGDQKESERQTHT